MIRVAGPRDIAAIREVEVAAFGQAGEADLVDRLRADGDALVELVSVEPDRRVVGHILFSRLWIGELAAAALAPVAVHPDRQGGGIGSELIRAGIETCRALAVPAIVVLGHPAYYPRFGFSAALAARLDAPFSGDAFMALELDPGALAEGGTLRYPPAFGL